MESPASRRAKLLPKKQNKSEVEGTVRKLPEPLISRILSFLPTKDAVRTCVLSKKWVYRWTFITKLHLDDSVFFYPKKKTGGKQHFVNFVYRALLLTKISTLDGFSLVIANKYDASLVNTWICCILNRGVKNLRVNSHSEISFSALTSHSLFNSKLLEELMLEMCCCGIKVTTTFVHFGHLKILKLSGIVFSLEPSIGPEFLTLSLPVLKEFVTVNCTWLSAKVITLKVPLLERVIIEQDAKSLSHDTLRDITFSALHLREFTYYGDGCISHYFALLDGSSAYNASLNVILKQCEGNIDLKTVFRACHLLEQFSQVKNLKFEGSMVLLTLLEVTNLPLFGMLTHLELGLVTCEVLLGLLLRSPVLETLVFKGVSKFQNELLNSTAVPRCLTSSLQVVKFEKLHGFEHELCLAKFMMENGLVLQRMSFSLAYQGLGKSKAIEEFKKKLFSFKKGFSFAIVEFSYD
ncbi:hypothetical protein RJT34_29337 [Clitoria ternatea]|uniref:F-box domain-containing protein n=1 Tax=Clitoria ternatea TaxID=43366 RepID=A0AAN9IC19_CLITE